VHFIEEESFNLVDL